jgi:hypothetical protein
VQEHRLRTRNVSPEVASRRARLASLVANGQPPEEIADAKTDLVVAGLEAKIRATVAAWPLTQAQRERLALLLVPGGEAATR